MGIYETEDILRRYGVDWEEWERIAALPRFQRLLETTTVEWGSTLNTKERIKVKALAGVEDGLASLFMSAKDTRETLTSRVEAYKLARVLAGIGERDPNEIPQEKFTLTINIGDESVKVGGPSERHDDRVIEGVVRDMTPGPQNLVEAVEKNTSQLFEFTSGVSDPGLNADLTSGYVEEMGGVEE